MSAPSLTAAIAAAFLCTASLTYAQEKTTTTLIPSGQGVEIYDVPTASPLPPPGRDTEKKIAPQLATPIQSLGQGPTYDLREMLELQGVTLRPQDIAIYSAESGLVYARSTPDKVTAIDGTLRLPDYSLIGYYAELEVRQFGTHGAKEGSRLAYFRFATVSGFNPEIALGDSSGSGEKKLSLETTLGSDSKTFDFNILGQLPIREETISLKLKSVGQVGVPIVVYERAKTGSNSPGLRVTLKLVQSDTGSTNVRNGAWRKRKIDEIEAELAHQSSAKSISPAPR